MTHFVSRLKFNRALVRASSKTYLHIVVFGMVYYCYFRELKSLFIFLLAVTLGLVPMANKVACNSFVSFSWYDLYFDLLLFTFRDNAILYVCD